VIEKFEIPSIEAQPSIVYDKWTELSLFVAVNILFTGKYQIPKRYIRGLDNAPRQKK
jgi:hypothetical protein